MTPRISIIIPTFNRARYVGRALGSCVRQQFSDWEAVVVDDGSNDDSATIVQHFGDSRVRLVRHDRNMGQCVARNSGANVANGDWLFFLDSDDELTANALEVVWQRVQALPDNIHRMFFAGQWDDGTVTPEPPFDGTRMAYADFLRWLEQLHGNHTETTSVVRREAFLQVPYPNRRSHEGGHNLDFTKRFDVIGFPDVVGLYHFDADNRLSDDLRKLDALIATAPGLASMADDVLAFHGDALRQHAPTMHQEFMHVAGLYHLLSGNKARGAALVSRAWMHEPLNLKTAGLLACALLPARTLARIKIRYGR